MQVFVGDIKLDVGGHKTVPVTTTLEPVEIGGQRVQFDQPFKGQAEIWNTGNRLLVRASVSGEATTLCSRCLGACTVPLVTSFEEEYVEGAGVDDQATADEERSVTPYQGEQIDLAGPLRENLLLDLPMKPLCSTECAGLCSTCGTNLNQSQCTCGENRPVDPRLSALQELLRKPEENQ